MSLPEKQSLGVSSSMKINIDEDKHRNRSVVRVTDAIRGSRSKGTEPEDRWQEVGLVDQRDGHLFWVPARQSCLMYVNWMENHDS